MAKTASKTRKKPAPKEEAPQPLLQPRIPIHGERVRRSGSDMEYEITYVSPDNTYVNIGIPRTNFEHRHVAVSALIFLEELRVTAKPARPPIDTAEIGERLDTVRHSVMDHISGELAILKKYLKSKGVSPEAAEALDAFCKQQDEAWKAIIEKITQRLEG